MHEYRHEYNNNSKASYQIWAPTQCFVAFRTHNEFYSIDTHIADEFLTDSIKMSTAEWISCWPVFFPIDSYSIEKIHPSLFIPLY